MSDRSSDRAPDQPPQLRSQARTRTVLRVGGALALVTGLGLAVVAGYDFFATWDSFEGPTKFWLLFAALPLLILGVWGLNAGFLGAGTRYAAGEVAPTLRDTLDYAGVGRGGVRCPSCGDRNDPDARFCDACGTALAPTCAHCGAANAADARFCDACGTALTAG